MSLDYNSIVKLVKRAALDVMAASKPVAVCMGTVISTDPVRIAVDQKMTLSASQLIITSNVRGSVSAGDKVLLIRCDGGQKYIVLDRMEADDG